MVLIVAVDEDWFTVEQIAARLQVAERTVRRWLTDGDLKGINFSGRTGWRIRGRDLDAFIQQRERGASQDAC